MCLVDLCCSIILYAIISQPHSHTSRKLLLCDCHVRLLDVENVKNIYRLSVPDPTYALPPGGL